jgi:hypothetical protein
MGAFPSFQHFNERRQMTESHMKRAKTRKCKQNIKNVSFLHIEANLFFRSRLTRKEARIILQLRHNGSRGRERKGGRGGVRDGN